MNDLPMSKNTSDIRRTKGPDAFSDFPLVDADQCVKCGLCLPHCPTYTLSLHEGDSPRGRIALMQGLAQGVIEPHGNAVSHLDGCLVCRACEPVCPAQVPYGRLIDAGRNGLWRSGHRPGRLWRLLAFFRRTPGRIAWLTGVIRLAHGTGLAALVARLPAGRLKRVAEFIGRPGIPPADGAHRPAGATTTGHVALFLGCIARPLDHSVLHAAIRVLTTMGFVVDVSRKQGCCGAMDAHAGDAQTLRALARNNIDAFAAGEHDAVISTASGCGVQLQDYRELPLKDASKFAARVHDVMSFAVAHAQHLPPLRHPPARVVMHLPCTLKNGMRERGALQMLQGIDGLQVEQLQHGDCCGAAGSYLFEHPGTADRLGNRLLDSLGQDIPDVFVTSNIGCALHLRRLARERGLRMKIAHPIEMLADSVVHSPDN